jgi:AraC family transcriptional regulator of arabinose operon
MVDTPAPPPGVLVADRFVRDASYAVRRSKGTRDCLATYTLAGAGRYRVGPVEWLCRPGDLALLLPSTEHDYATGPSGHWSFYWVHALLPPEWDELLQFSEHAPGLVATSLPLALRDRAARCFARMVEDQHRTGFGRALALNALHELLLLGASAAPHISRMRDARINHAEQIIRERFRESLTVAGLAKAVAMSPSHFAHLFRQQVGRAPLEFILQTRLAHAARLLEFTDMQVGQIAAEVGFSGVFYFSRRFAAVFGVSPTAYRRRVRSGDAPDWPIEGK